MRLRLLRPRVRGKKMGKKGRDDEAAAKKQVRFVVVCTHVTGRVSRI